MTTIVLVTQHALAPQDAKELTTAGGASPADSTFHVVVPEEATSASMSAVLDDWEMDATAGRGSGVANHPDLQVNPGAVARHQAQEVLDKSLSVLRAAGATATGEVTPGHPLESVGDLVAHHHPDEVVVMIRHHTLSELTSGDLAAKIQ